MSGHGFQVDDDGTDEIDKRDGIFMPSDSGEVVGSKRPRNVITDDEFARAVEAIRRKGATVVLLLAFSHAGDFIDDLNFGTGTAVVAGITSTSATSQDKHFLVPHRDYGAPQFPGSPMLTYVMLEMAKQDRLAPIALYSHAIAPWLERPRYIPLAFPFGRTDVPAL
jgi:hypothetical protein